MSVPLPPVKSSAELEKELADMRRKSLDLEQCHAEFLNVQKRYDQLLQSAPDAMVFVSSDAKIVLLNAQLLNLFGYTEGELIGRDLDCLLPEQYREEHRRHVKQYFVSPVVRTMGTNIIIYGRKKDGTQFPADISLSPLQTDGGLVAVAAIRDITERKKAEEEKQRLREQIAEIEKFSALGRIAANVADEIRNPLTAVGGFARRLQKIVDSEKEKKYTEYIISEVDRLESILKDVLAYSRTRSPHLDGADLIQLIGTILKSWEQRLVQQNIEVTVSYSAATAYIDAELTGDAIDRIIANAVEAMPKSGTLTVTVDSEKVNGVRYARVKIQDTGTGIPADKLSMVFEPFFTTRQTRRGTGLGLSIAKNIVEEEGGKIKLESTEDAGTTVTLYFPDVRQLA